MVKIILCIVVAIILLILLVALVKHLIREIKRDCDPHWETLLIFSGPAILLGFAFVVDISIFSVNILKFLISNFPIFTLILLLYSAFMSCCYFDYFKPPIRYIPQNSDNTNYHPSTETNNNYDYGKQQVATPLDKCFTNSIRGDIH